MSDAAGHAAIDTSIRRAMWPPPFGGRTFRTALFAVTALTAPAGTAAATSETSEPEPSERVVVLAEEFMLADVLALGIEPIASSVSVTEAGIQGIEEFDTAGIEILPMTTLSLERLASIEPDVIITLQFWVDQLGEDVLAGMADLVVVPDGLSAPERVLALGDLLGRQDKAATVVAELEEATARTRDAVAGNCVVSLAAIYPGPTVAAFVAGPWDLPSSLLAAGCTFDPDDTHAEPDQNGRVFLSLERLDMLDAPTLILLQNSTVEGEDSAVEEIEANPLWQQLPAVRSGHVIVFDRLGYPGASGQIRFLDELAELFG